MYDSYDDWYDNGPGSEAFKRKIRQSEKDFWSQYDFIIKDGFFGWKKKETKETKK